MIMAQESEIPFRLNDLPYELQHQIIKYAGEDRWGQGSLVDIACVNSHYYELATKLMGEFEFDNIEDFDGFQIQNFIETMACGDDSRTDYMRRLHLNTGWQKYVHGFPRVSSPDLFGVWALNTMTNLKELRVSYAFDHIFMYEKLPPRLETLIIRPEGLPGYDYKFRDFEGSADAVELAGIVKAHFFESVLTSKSLKRFDLGCQHIRGDRSVEDIDVPVKTSLIEDLTFTVGNFSNRALSKFLRVPRALRFLKFTPPRFEDVHYPSEHPDGIPTAYAADLPAMSTFGIALATQTATLETLTIRRGDSQWTTSLDQIGSLAKFHALKHLEVDITTLLGWDHCAHLRRFDENSPIHPSYLATVLPSNLETLTLHFEYYHKTDGVDYMIAALKALKKASPARLPCLRIVTFDVSENLPYCTLCDEESPRTTWATVDRTWIGPRDITTEQTRLVRAWGRHAPFKFRLRTADDWRFWDEVDDGDAWSVAAVGSDVGCEIEDEGYEDKDGSEEIRKAMEFIEHNW